MSTERHAFTNQTSTILVPPLRICLANDKLEIDVTASISLDLPEILGHVTTVNDLVEAVERDNLWIARLGTCYIEVSTTVDGHPILDHGQLEIFGQMIKNSEIWNRLGLRLGGDGVPALQLPSLISFSIQHPDLNSALLPPSSALVAHFRALKLSINISEVGNQRVPEEEPSKRGRRKKKTRVKERDKTEATSDDEFFSSLAFDDRQAIDVFMSSLNLPSHGSQIGSAQSARHSCISIGDILGTISSLPLIDILLDRLLLGSKKRHRGLQITGSSPSHCLTKLAPAVFHVPYLKMISDRASLLPIISSSLARMRNAESPSVRQKIEEVSTRSTAIGISTPLKKGSAVFRGIEKHGWDVLLAHCQASPLRSVNKTTMTEHRTRDQAATRGTDQMEITPMAPLLGHQNNQVREFVYEWETLNNTQALGNVYPPTAYNLLTPTNSQSTEDSNESLSTEDFWDQWEYNPGHEFNGYRY